MNKPQINFNENNEWIRPLIKQYIFSSKTYYHNIDIVLLRDYGKALLINDEVKFTDKTKYIYAESFIHPALSVLPNISRNKNILLLDCTAEELTQALKWTNLTKIDMVYIDSLLAELCYKHWQPKPISTIYREVKSNLTYITQDLNIDATIRSQEYDVIYWNTNYPISHKKYKALSDIEFITALSNKMKDESCLVLNTTAMIDIVKQIFDKVLVYETKEKEYEFMLATNAKIDLERKIEPKHLINDELCYLNTLGMNDLILNNYSSSFR